MAEKLKRNKAAVLIAVLFFIFAAVQCSLFVLCGDDFWWTGLKNAGVLFGDEDINGRYLTNIITYLVIKHPVLRAVLCTSIFSIMFFLLTLILKRSGRIFPAASFSAFCLLTIPTIIVSLTTNWISGFTNYIISAVLTLAYIYFCLPLLNGNGGTQKPQWAVYTIFLGFFGALCVENITLYNILMGIFMLVLSVVRTKKPGLPQLLYLAGAIIGAVLMFLNKNYSGIVGEGDSVGFRAVEIDFSDMFMTLYKDIMLFIAKPFYLLHIAAAVSFLGLYAVKYGCLTGKSAPKYAKFFMPVIVCFAVYSTFSMCFVNPVSLTMAFRTASLEAAFTFVYFIALLYMAWHLFERNAFMRFAFFLLSVVVVTAPFLAVKPVTSRCFFATNIFWALTAGEAVMNAVTRTDSSTYSRYRPVLRFCITAVIGFFSFAYSYINISNYSVDRLRVNYIKEQVSQNRRLIELISLPYEEYCGDSIEYLMKDEELMQFNMQGVYKGYARLMLDYWGIEEDLSDKNFLLITTVDYYESHTNE